ncbi:MAG: glycerol-3-phosphate dehydrogenase/oxidase [Paenibacillaceae bacterium]|jgi:glycerol-3-phosphate dehydrogenase|nr:glycerol-3-phosphate dehydrogenase/oxidase [Paenibacillaceae bacterium]
MAISHFSAKLRGHILQEMASNVLDLLVIGGGITGAGIVWDASLRGLRCGLVEMGDFASGTSSRSTKLVHGGLRYLKQGEVKLVMEVGRERALLHRNAPHVVIPEPMLLPIYKGGTFGYWMSSVGLYVYDLLAGVKRKERRRMYRRNATIKLEPLFKQDLLIGSGYYYEYRTDDARLTAEVMKTAVAHGAHAVNYTKASEFLYKDGRVVGIRATDVLSGETYDIYAKKIVNAAGPWVDRVRQMDNSLKGKRLLLTKGVHLVVDYNRLPIRQAAYFDVPDGRMIFVIPRDGKTYIGTTDTVYKEQIEDTQATAEDRDYLLHATNAAFPEVKLTTADVESCWAGLRPLIYEEGKGPSEISRKDEIFVSDSGLITIAGGKLTGFRKMAEKVVDLTVKLLSEQNGSRYLPCATATDVLSGGNCDGFDHFDQFKKVLSMGGVKIGIEERTATLLASRYGSNVNDLFQLYEGALAQAGSPEEAALMAEVTYGIEREMAVCAVDFLIRRTGMLLFDRPRAEKIKDDVIRLMGDALGWDAAERERQSAEVDRQLALVKEFPHEKAAAKT